MKTPIQKYIKKLQKECKEWREWGSKQKEKEYKEKLKFFKKFEKIAITKKDFELVQKLLDVVDFLENYKLEDTLTRKQIAICRKNNIIYIQKLGEWNGFGYEKLGQMIDDRKELKKARKIFQKIRKEIEKELQKNTKRKRKYVSPEEKIKRQLEKDWLGTVVTALYNINKIAKKWRDKREELIYEVYEEGNKYYSRQSHEALKRYKWAIEDLYDLKDFYLKKLIQKENAKPEGYHLFTDGIERDYYIFDEVGFHLNEKTSKKFLGEIDKVDAEKTKRKKMSEKMARLVLKLAFE